MAASGPFKNTVLQHLSAAAIQRLDLKRLVLDLQANLALPDGSIERVVFVEEGVGSMTTMFRDGTEVEVCMFGYESVVGVSALMGARRSLNRVFMQVAGYGYSSPLETVRREFVRQGELQRLALSYVQAQLTQSMQNAACNAVHNAEQRLARWLLTIRDRAHADTFRFSHEFMAVMLGSTRATVTLSAGALKDLGLIRYSRGVVQVLDARALERQAGECYGAVAEYLRSAVQFEDDFVR